MSGGCTNVVAGELLYVDEVIHFPHLLHVDSLRQQNPVVFQLRHERPFHMANLKNMSLTQGHDINDNFAHVMLAS